MVHKKQLDSSTVWYKYICNIHFNFLFHCQTGIKISSQNLSLMSGLRAGAHCMWNQVRSLFGFMWIKRISCKPEVYARWTRLTGCQKRNTHNLACFQRKSLIKTVEKGLLKSCKTKWRQPAPFFNAIYLPHAREHSHICCYHAIVRARVCPCALYTLHNQLTVCRSYSDVSDV